jgi:hypothetical protein
VPARLLPQARLRFLDVSVSGPAVRGAARDLTVPEVPGGGAAVLGGELELRSRFLVEPRLGGESLVQFQTLTSR